jgi:hypothetical protein
MAKVFTAPFAQTPQEGCAIVTAVCSNVSISTSVANTVLLATAGLEGAIVTRISAIPRATVAPTSLLLFDSPDTGTNKNLVDSAVMAAHSVAAATAIPVTAFTRYSEDTPLRLEAGEQLYAGIGVALAAGIVFNAEWTDF